MDTRLSSIAADLVARLATSTDARRKVATLAACRFALAQNEIDSTHLSGALECVLENGRLSAELRSALEKQIADFDHGYFAKQDEGHDVEAMVFFRQSAGNIKRCFP